MNVLDLFSGLGGWSNVWKQAGHEVTTVDIDARFNPTVCMSVLDFHTHTHQFDVILASPPCDEFSRWTMRGVNVSLRKRHAAGQLHPPSLALVEATARIIATVQPRFWVVENVHGSPQFISTVLGPHRGCWAKRYLWGNFSDLGDLQVASRAKASMSSSWVAERAEIPHQLASAILRACTTQSYQEVMSLD